MTQRQMKLFLALLIVAGIGAILVAGKRAQCEQDRVPPSGVGAVGK
jgi:hypothetical protein